MDLITQQRIAFRNGLKNDYYRKTTFDVSNLELFSKAVRSGYGDAKRTFKNIGAFWNGREAEKQAFFNKIAENIQKVFLEAVSDDWHEKLCALFLCQLEELGYSSATYGQAQKVINMAFKYLFCMEGAENHAFFARCHMPLDSYTLSWYHKIAGKKAAIKKDATWSGLSKVKYAAIQDYIFSALKEGCQLIIDKKTIPLPPQPLFAEFIIWPEEILLRAGNDFMTTLNPDFKKKASDSMQLLKDILRNQLPQYCNLEVSISEKK